jgi:RNA polymerase sigma-70 factor (ECF subfamily)
VSANLIAQARAGDDEAFRELIDPHRRELQVHCYRILGSAADAEDALQDTLLAAWQGLGGFEERASLRTWLYRVATSRCLNALRARSRRPPVAAPPGQPHPLPGADPPPPTRLGEVTWLEPYPDALLAGLADSEPGPEARYEATEAISLAFITALQLLPPRQRAVLILRDVLGFRASEAAAALGASEESVTSALKRARATLRRQSLPGPDTEPPPAPGSAAEQDLIARLTRAYQDGDVAAIVGLFTEDAWLTMPPVPLEYQGRDLVRQFMERVAFRRGRSYALVPARANGQLAFAAYLRDPQPGSTRANGMLVLTLTGSRISAMNRFPDTVLPRFGLPRDLPPGYGVVDGGSVLL